MQNQEPVVVIGAGLGGMAAAIHLALHKIPVIILEKNARVGGKMMEIAQDGFRWDIGPSVITMRDVLEDLFAAAGRRLQDQVQLIPVEPLTRYFFADGKRLDLSRDLSKTAAAIAALEPRDVEGYLSFLAYAARQFRLTAPVYTYGPTPRLGSLRKIGLAELPQVDAFRDMHTAQQEFVRSPYLRQILARFATYVGASPYKAPALLNQIAHVELTGGVWYPRGGVYSLAQAIERLAVDLGVKIRTNTAVSQVVIVEGEARGVLLEDGTPIEAGAVISNVDALTTYTRLLPQKPPYTWELEKFTQLPLSTSAFILLLGVKAKHPDLAHHNIFFSANYEAEFTQIFDQHIPPTEPTIYVAITSKADMQHAPIGCENWFVMVNTPPHGPKYDWRASAISYRQRVLDLLAQRGYDLAGKIVTERMFTPLDLEAQNGAYRGALYGISFNERMAPFRRPPPQPKKPEGLFFTGGTTHPGGGVPLVVLSGRHTAGLVMDYFAAQK